MMKSMLKRGSWFLTLVGVLIFGVALGSGAMYMLSQGDDAQFISIAQAQSAEMVTESGILVNRVVDDSPAAEAFGQRAQQNESENHGHGDPEKNAGSLHTVHPGHILEPGSGPKPLDGKEGGL